MASSVFSPQLATLFGFFMFFSLTRISFSLLAVIFLFLPHDSQLTISSSGKGGGGGCVACLAILTADYSKCE